MWIDTHAHLYLSQFDDDIDSVLDRCSIEGVNQILLPDIDKSTTESLWKLVDAFPSVCFGMSGLHPCSVKKNFKQQLDHVFSIASEKPVIAIGEIGLDYYWDKTLIDEQKMAYESQIIWAKDHGLPIVIHSRDSLDDTISMVEKHQDGNLKGVFHCFNGTVEQMNRIQEIGFHMGLGGVITFKNSKMEEVLDKIQMDYVILETDAPYLTPTPHRGKRNESSYIPLVAKRLVQEKKVNLNEIAFITTRNAKKLFCLP